MAPSRVSGKYHHTQVADYLPYLFSYLKRIPSKRQATCRYPPLGGFKQVKMDLGATRPDGKDFNAASQHEAAHTEGVIRPLSQTLSQPAGAQGVLNSPDLTTDGLFTGRSGLEKEEQPGANVLLQQDIAGIAASPEWKKQTVSHSSGDSKPSPVQQHQQQEEFNKAALIEHQRQHWISQYLRDPDQLDTQPSQMDIQSSQTASPADSEINFSSKRKKSALPNQTALQMDQKVEEKGQKSTQDEAANSSRSAGLEKVNMEHQHIEMQSNKNDRSAPKSNEEMKSVTSVNPIFGSFTAEQTKEFKEKIADKQLEGDKDEKTAADEQPPAEQFNGWAVTESMRNKDQKTFATWPSDSKIEQVTYQPHHQCFNRSNWTRKG